jgi:hypothetical protein
MTAVRDRFRTIVVIDTEFHGADLGERHHVVALVAHVYVDGHLVRTIQLFEDDLHALRHSPLPDGPDVLYVGFVLQAEWRSMLALGWSLPRNSIDLFAEARCLRNLALPYRVLQGLKVRGYGLIDTCRHYGLPAIDPADKDEMRDLILSGGPWSGAERMRILDYCGHDVTMTQALWDHLAPRIPPGPALYRGWYTQAVAAMEDRGIPIDVDARDRLVENLAGLRRELLLRFDGFGLCDPDSDSMAIDPDRLLTLVNGRGIRWPSTATGRPVTRLKALKSRLAPYPELHGVVSLQQGLNDLKGLRSLPIAHDGRARASLWPFGTNTGRNRPDGKAFLFQFSKWTRGLIRPGPDRFVCYADWSAQEFATIAYLSNDPLLIHCYESPGDPYCNLGIIMGLMPPGATKDHPDRDVLKTVSLGMFYGRGARSIAGQTRRPVPLIQSIVDEFWSRCPRAERWLESYQDGLVLTGRAWTKFGWTIHRHRLTKSTSAANFPVQSHAAEQMRWASCLGLDNGVPMCCPVHDAFLVEGLIEDEEQIVDRLSRCMERASAIVLGGPIVRAQPVVFRYPERFADRKGWRAWSWIMRTIDPAYAALPARVA